jgi:hypothetical protein
MQLLPYSSIALDYAPNRVGVSDRRALAGSARGVIGRFGHGHCPDRADILLPASRDGHEMQIPESKGKKKLRSSPQLLMAKSPP